MVQAAVPLQAVSGSDRLAKYRGRFLAAEPVNPREVREPILASWRRSRDWRVAADLIELGHRDPDPETPWRGTPTRAAASARSARRTAHQHHPHRRQRSRAEPADGRSRSRTSPRWRQAGAGLQLLRRSRRHERDRHRAGSRAANARLRPRALRGEARGDGLRGGAHPPPHHRQDGRRDRPTCWRKNADPLPVALVKSTADQITQALLNGSNNREFSLLEEYVRACRLYRRDRPGDRQRRGDDERLRPAAP